jgi:GT2 family glycosyltransferase
VAIAVFDDASTDGTPEAILQRYPDVTIVYGDGNAFWNGGLYQLWSEVQEAPVDAFLWLNDDTFLDDDALMRLTSAFVTIGREDRRAILVGATRGEDGQVSYSGYDVVHSPFAFRLKRVFPDVSTPKPVTTFNGNVVLIGRGALSIVGLNDPSFFHNLGDVDYGLRAQRAGVPILLLPGTLGVCDSNVAKRDRGYGSPHLSLRDQWRKVNTHHGLPFRSWWRFTRRHSGKWWPVQFILPYRHLLRFWKLRSTI